MLPGSTGLIADWSRRYDADELVAMLDASDIPNSKAYTAADLCSRPAISGARMVREVEDPHFGSVLQAGIVPHIPESPGEVRWSGPDIGEHSHQLLRELLGFGQDDIAMLERTGVICVI